MKTEKQKLITLLFLFILIGQILPLVEAAPVGTSESTVVAASKSWLGVKSVHGGNDRSGIDCSHLVYQVYKEVGAKDLIFQKVPSMKKNADYVKTISPTPGDVIFWQKDVIQNGKTYWLAAHVGIYIGNNQFIDTSFDTKNVAIESISGIYKDGMPYYARWTPAGSANTPTQTSDATDNNDESANSSTQISDVTDNNDANTPAQTPDVTADNNGSNLPVASFSATPNSGNAPLTVSFTDRSTDETSWFWKFGDGNTSNERNPTHNYSEAGNYTVVLTVNNGNNANSTTQNIIVQQAQDQETILPVTDFNANTTSGYAPLSVQFTDISQNENGWNWDFGDGNNSTEQNPVHTYYTTGTYTVTLTATNENGTSSTKNATITVTQQDSSDGESSSSEESSSSSGSSSGGGSVGGSPEPASNVQVKEISQNFIPSDKEITFNFTKNTTCVESITFRSTKTVGKTTTIVEELKNKSSLISKYPEGIVYRSFNIWVGNGGYGNSKNIENSSVNFKVNISWVQENNINRSSIILNTYDSVKKEWMKLPTNITGEDDKFLHFTANVPGYSFFAITCTNSEHNAITTELSQTTTSNTENSNKSKRISTDSSTENYTSTIASKIAEETKKTSGFSVISSIICLLCVFWHKVKER
jgi:PGF-pre-PGF domain-containing protein